MANSADSDLHCLQRQDISGFCRTSVNIFLIFRWKSMLWILVRSASFEYPQPRFCSGIRKIQILFGWNKSLIWSSAVNVSIFIFNHSSRRFSSNDIFYFIASWNIGCGYSLEKPHRGASNEYPLYKKNMWPPILIWSYEFQGLTVAVRTLEHGSWVLAISRIHLRKRYYMKTGRMCTKYWLHPLRQPRSTKDHIPFK